MVYITGTVTDANPGPALYALIAPALTAAGYTLVDTVVISTRTHKVYKSVAANNSAGKDWFLDVAYPTSGAGHMFLLPMEFFDPATHLAYRTAFAGNSQTVEQTNYSRFGATGYTLEDSNLSPNAGTTGPSGPPTNMYLQVSTSAFGYWISITGSRVVALSSVNPSFLTYAGCYTPTSDHAAVAGAFLFPLIAVTTGVGGAVSSWRGDTAGVALCRVPKQPSAAGSANGWGDSVSVSPVYAANHAPAFPGGSTAMANRAIGPLRIVAGVGLPGAGIFGHLDGVGYTGTAGVVRGDTCLVGADTWVFGSTASSASLLLKAV